MVSVRIAFAIFLLNGSLRSLPESFLLKPAVRSSRMRIQRAIRMLDWITTTHEAAALMRDATGKPPNVPETLASKIPFSS